MIKKFSKLQASFEIEFCAKYFGKCYFGTTRKTLSRELMDALQFAYRAKHSAETPLLKVQSDVSDII